MAEQFESWAIVEVMGQQTYAGKVSEQSVGGASFVRVDIPDVKGQSGFTKLFGGSSIYCITPCTEQIARMTAERVQARAVSIYDLPADWKNAIDQRRINFSRSPDGDDETEF
ncbi:MAG: hypothetical protein KDB14_29435 [Planctomycetales bacterium]|nr:hypothetical protein [Planctomycetales bacterium]